MISLRVSEALLPWKRRTSKELDTSRAQARATTAAKDAPEMETVSTAKGAGQISEAKGRNMESATMRTLTGAGRAGMGATGLGGK